MLTINCRQIAVLHLIFGDIAVSVNLLAPKFKMYNLQILPEFG